MKGTLAAARSARVAQGVGGGGVAANGRLRERLAAEGARAGLEVILPAPRLCTDNGAMIAALGTRLLEAGVRDGLDLDVHPRLLRNPSVKKKPVARRPSAPAVRS